MALNGFLEFFQKGKVGPGLHLRSNNVYIHAKFLFVYFTFQLAHLFILDVFLINSRSVVYNFNILFSFLSLVCLYWISWHWPLVDRHFGQRNDLLRERYGIRYTNKHKPVYNRALIYGKWSNYRTEKIWTIGLQCTVNVVCNVNSSHGYWIKLIFYHCFQNSCGLFQSNQSHLWHCIRVLQWDDMPDHVWWTKIRIPVGWWWNI